jgi:hypothetical protein
VTDAESVAVTAALRAALPQGQYLLSTASWHVGAYGEGAFKNAQPASQYTGMCPMVDRLPGHDPSLAVSPGLIPASGLSASNPLLPPGGCRGRAERGEGGGGRGGGGREGARGKGWRPAAHTLKLPFLSHLTSPLPRYFTHRCEPCNGQVPCWPSPRPGQHNGL